MDFQSGFRRAVAAVATRFLAQNGLAPLGGDQLRALADGLMAAGDDVLREGEIPDEVVKEGVARLLALLSTPRPELAVLAKQLIKGCHQPDKPTCCESYHETDAAGRCRRQELAYDLGRLSGAHCVDCPHWRDWTPEGHVARLTAEWRDGAAVFMERREVFLPEDFRALRLLIQSQA